MKRILLLGSLPPPIGGVTRSVENLYNSLISKDISVEVFSKKSLFKFRKFDVAHIHYSKSWKRLLGFVIGKLLAKKVIFTLHGNKYNDDLFNRLICKIADGIIFLNETVSKKYISNFNKSIILTSLFKEGIQNISISSNIIEKNDSKIYLLVYAYDKVYQDGKDIYGVDFILNNLNSLPTNYVVVLLDPKQGYKNDISQLSNERLIYLDREVNFYNLLSQIDIYIRPTSTDGNSVAIQEALMLGKKVLASDVVDRGIGVITYKYNDFDNFTTKLSLGEITLDNYEPDSINKYLAFIGEL